ncbi:MAG: GntR family transcriptional regulator [Bacteroidota bacterium]|nr:GntR family transcriptional regulator [Bacteroidota bacterium]MDP4227737.1 GntR family transcriptional regulator [Bacteroidota bacterium]MDP4275540.1 GntR family transcriptional regulator [Bacteroidota bacterium]
MRKGIHKVRKHESNIPQYRILYENLRKDIVDGVYKEGDLLPSENELCAAYGLTRPTVRHALDTLLYDGCIIKQKGKGSIVQAMPNGIGILSLAGVTYALGQANVKTKILVPPFMKEWDKDFPFPLSSGELEAKCLYLERLRVVNDVPLFYDINLLPNINLPGFADKIFENNSLFNILRQDYQIEIKGGEQKLRALSADEKTGDLLQVKKGDPVLYLERKLYTNRLNFYIYSILYCNTKEHALFGTF